MEQLAGFQRRVFCKFFPDIEITLIESPSIPKIGVGESTTPQVNMFFNTLGIDKKDFLKSIGFLYEQLSLLFKITC